VNRGLLYLLSWLAAAQSGCWTGDYLAKQGLGQWHLLRARRRISDVLADPAVDAETKQKLALAAAARDFGVRVLGLRGGDAYTRFLDTRGEPIAWNVSAAQKDALVPYIHRFPLVGAISYVGYFREADAHREQARLDGMGLDTYLRPVAGYSTLGMTSDPIYSSMLEGSDARIVEVVLHEMLHGTLFLSGQPDWNESLATFVGLHGAAAFFAARGSEDTADSLLADAEKRQRNQERFASVVRDLVGELQTLYGSSRTRDQKLREREAVFARARRRYLELYPPKPGGQVGGFAQQPLNNAVVISYSVYHRSTPDHERLFARLGGDLPRFIRLYRHAVENHEDPIDWLKSL
jgi:predicted aminopeptidase